MPPAGPPAIDARAGADAPIQDGGRADASASDAGSPDAAASDAPGPPGADAAPPDARARDAAADAVAPDASIAVDASPDAPRDAAPPDAVPDAPPAGDAAAGGGAWSCGAGCRAVDVFSRRAGPIRIPLSAMTSRRDAWPFVRVRMGSRRLPLRPLPGSDPAVVVYVPDVAPDGYSREAHLRVDIAPADPSPWVPARPAPAPLATVTRIVQRRTVEPRTFWAYYHQGGTDTLPDAWAGPRTRAGEQAEAAFEGHRGTARAVGLELDLFGGADVPGPVEVRLGGHLLGIVDLPGWGATARAFAPDRLAPDASGAFALALSLASGAAPAASFNLRAAALLVESELAIDGVTLLEGHEARPVDVVIDSYAGAAPVAWDVTDPLAPVQLDLRGDSGRLVLPGYSPGRTYLLFDPTRVPDPDGVLPVSDDSRVLWEQGDLIVVAPPPFHPGLQGWLAAAGALGWTPVVRTPRELYQVFTDGRPGPQAISRYLEHAGSTWRVRSPRALLLAGDVSPELDAPGGAPDWHVPTWYLFWPGHLWVPSDLVYALPDWIAAGPSAPPRLAVGRIPARSPAELEAALARTLAHREATLGGALFVSDDEPIWRTLAEQARARTGPALPARALHLHDYDFAYPPPSPPPPQWLEPAALALRADLRAALAGGARLVEYFGHGDLNQLAGEALLSRRPDFDNLAQTLTHGGLPPLFIVYNCLSGDFGLPAPAQVLAEAMVLPLDASIGAAGVVSSSAYGDAGHSARLSAALDEALVASESVGLALVRSARAMLDSPACRETYCRVQTMAYNLLGDPTLPAPLSTAAPGR